MKTLAIALLALAPTLGFAATAANAPTPPDQVIQNTAEKLTSELRGHQKELRNDQPKLFAMVEEGIQGRFDFPYMARLVLGRAWRDATPAQRKAFTEAFRTMLIRTYSNALLEYADTKVDFQPLRMQPGDKDVSYNAIANLASGQKVPMSYRLHLHNGAWQVYDITIDSVSLVTNYRGVFGGEIRKNGIDALIKRLQAKNQNIAGQ